MSFWPRLRRRSNKGRKKSSSTTTTTTTRTNPYASRDSFDNYRAVRAELLAQRAKFASEKGVPVSVVRYISRSSRGWVHLPPLDDSSMEASPDRGSSSDVTISTSSNKSQEFSLPPPALPLPSAARTVSRARSVDAESSGVVHATGSDLRGGSRNAGRLVRSRRLKDEAWILMNKTAAILLVKVLVFSRALGASSVFAFTIAVVVDIWNRGSVALQGVFSALASQLLTSLKPCLSLPRSKSVIISTRGGTAADKPVVVAQSSPGLQLPAAGPSNEMKVLPVTDDPDLQDSGSSSFAFPVLPRNSVVGSPIFPAQSGGDKSGSKIGSSSPELSSQVSSPLVESNKLPPAKPCQKLKLKLFKCSSPARKGENSSPLTESFDSNDAASSGSSSACSSPARGKSTKKKSSFIGRKHPQRGEEESQLESQRQPSKPVKKVTRSHELVFFRSPNNNRRKEFKAAAKDVSVSSLHSADVDNLSRSQELKFSLNSLLGKKKVSRSQEFNISSPLRIEDLTLPRSTVEGLEALAFPFRDVEQDQVQQERSSVTSSPIRGRKSLSNLMSVEPTYEKYSSKCLVGGGSSVPRGSTAGGSNKGAKGKTGSAPSTFLNPSMLSAEELKPGLRRVKTCLSPSSKHQSSELRKTKTAVVNRGSPLTTQSGELGRSQVLSREVLGSILLFAVLVTLMLGRIPAVFCTSFLCLVLSQFQRFFWRHLTPRDKDLLKRGSGMSRLHQSSSSPANWQNGLSSNHGSPLHDRSGLQSSEYRKRVVIEGLLERGNRRGTGMS